MQRNYKALTMKIAIKHWGSSAGISISKALRNHLRVDIGDIVNVQMINEGLLICRAERQPFNLDELLATCTRQNTGLEAEDFAWLRDSLE